MLCVIWDFLEYFKFEKESKTFGGRRATLPWLGRLPVGKEPGTPSVESAVTIAPGSKEPPAARA